MTANSSITGLPDIPSLPGCYFFKDKVGTLLYIGKAKDLKRRVSSYFNRPPDSDKTSELVKRVASVEFMIVDTEVEALLLEARLIRQHKPPYNIDLKENERYAYILVTDEAFPRVMTARGRRRKGRWFGPFVDGAHRRALIRTVSLLTKLRTCQSLPKRACLQYHLGHCTAPCIGKVDRTGYAGQIAEAVRLLEGKSEGVIARLMEEMAAASAGLKFERARELRDQLAVLSRRADRQKIEARSSKDQDVIVCVRSDSLELVQVFHVKRGVLLGKEEFRFRPDGILAQDGLSEFLMQYYTGHEIPDEIVMEKFPDDAQAVEGALSRIKESGVRIISPSRGRSRELLDLVRKNALVQLGAGDVGLKDLQDALRLPSFPKVIECFDISHLSGSNTVASMVQLVDAQPRKSSYRRFKIKTVEGIDDFASMREVVLRRYRRLRDEGKPMPDLIVIDGGAGQLSAARDALKELAVVIPIIGLAKRLEEIYIPSTERPLLLDHRREGLKVLQRARDEAHRFAITFQRSRRSKSVF